MVAGHKTGVCTSWTEVKRHIPATTELMCRKFDTRMEAVEFPKDYNHWTKRQGEEDGAFGLIEDEDIDGEEEQ